MFKQYNYFVTKGRDEAFQYEINLLAAAEPRRENEQNTIFDKNDE